MCEFLMKFMELMDCGPVEYCVAWS